MQSDPTQPEQSPAPRPVHDAVPWTAFEIFSAVFLGSLCPTLVYALLEATGWLTWFYGADLITTARQGTGITRQLAQYRLSLWASCLAFPCQVGITLWLFRIHSGTRPEQLGLTWRHAGRNLLAGLLGAAILTPGVYGMQEVVLWLFRQFGMTEAQLHPFAQLAEEPLYPVEWVLLLLAAIVVAPVWEEIVFRGILQPWVMTRPLGAPIVLGAALFFALSSRAERLPAAWHAGSAALLDALAPSLAVLALLPVYFFLASRRRPDTATAPAAGLFAVAVLFAWVHARVWPSPLALLWLALGLGWLAWKSRSLLGPIVLHAVFNGLACAVLLWPLVRRFLSG